MFAKGKLAIAAGTLALCAANTAGQEAGQATAPTGSCRVRVPVNVYDTSGNRPSADTRYGIRTRQKGLKLVARRGEKDSRRLVLLLDISGSMRGVHGHLPKAKEGWIEAREIGLALMSKLQPGDWAGLHIFATGHKVEVPLSPDLNPVVEALRNLPDPATKEVEATVGYLTVFGEAIQEVLRVEREKLRPGDAVILLSDGEGQEGRASRKPMLAEMAERGIRLFLLRAGAPHYVPVPERREMTDWVMETGGLTLRKWRLAEIGSMRTLQPEFAGGDAEIAQLTYHLVRVFDWVELEFAKCDGKARKLTLELRAEKGRKTGYEELLYPRQVVLPAPGSEQKN